MASSPPVVRAGVCVITWRRRRAHVESQTSQTRVDDMLRYQSLLGADSLLSSHHLSEAGSEAGDLHEHLLPGLLDSAEDMAEGALGSMEGSMEGPNRHLG